MPILLAITLLLSACSKDDDDAMPSVFTDLVVAKTDANSVISSITTDDGKEWGLNHTIVSDVKDSLMRCYCVYKVEGGKLSVYTLKGVFSSYPKEASKYNSLPTDPVKVVSLWKSGGYLNMHLGIMTTGGGAHKYGFALDSIHNATDNLSKGTAWFSFLHERPSDDAESYTEDHYFSMPIGDYADYDSIIVSINTYEGSRTFRF